MAGKVTPLGQRIIIQAQAAEEVTSFGLVLSDAGKEKPMEGKVIAISSEIKDSPVQEGDLVIYKKYAATEFKMDGEVISSKVAQKIINHYKLYRDREDKDDFYNGEDGPKRIAVFFDVDTKDWVYIVGTKTAKDVKKFIEKIK